MKNRYAATRGFFWSHMGWIFFKKRYERLELIDKVDLQNDEGARVSILLYIILLKRPFIVVRFQHQYYGAYFFIPSSFHR